MRRIVCAASLAAVVSLASAEPERTPLEEPIPEFAFPCAGAAGGATSFGSVLWEEEIEAINAMLVREIEPLEFVRRMIEVDLRNADAWRWLMVAAYVCPGPQA